MATLSFHRLRPGDTIVAINGMPIRERDDLFLAIGSCLAGSEARIEVRNANGAQRTATAVLDKLSGAVLLETRNRDARMQFLTAIVEQLLVDNKRARDTDAAVMNMQLGRLRDGHAAGTALVDGAAADLRSWKQP